MNVEEVHNLAISYYYRHIGLSQMKYPYLWDQAEEEYKNCFILLATLDLEGREVI
jgi:hypothetical protein